MAAAVEQYLELLRPILNVMVCILSGSVCVSTWIHYIDPLAFYFIFYTILLTSGCSL